MTMRITKIMVLFSLTLGLSRCASITSLQSARTLKTGEVQKTVGLGYGSTKLDTSDSSATTAVVDVMVRYGLTDQDEIGGRVAGNLSYYIVDYKRGLTQGTVGLAAGVGAGGTQYTVLDEKTTVIDVMIPIYVDFNISPGFALILSPKYMGRYLSQTQGSDWGNLIGGSGGFRFGEKSGLIAEVGYLKPLSGGDGVWQVMGGFHW